VPNPVIGGKFYAAFAVQFVEPFTLFATFGEGLSTGARSFYNGYNYTASTTNFAVATTFCTPLNYVFETKTLDHDRYVIEFWSNGDGHIYSAFDTSVPVALNFIAFGTSHMIARVDAATGGKSTAQIENAILVT